MAIVLSAVLLPEKVPFLMLPRLLILICSSTTKKSQLIRVINKNYLSSMIHLNQVCRTLPKFLVPCWQLLVEWISLCSLCWTRGGFHLRLWSCWLVSLLGLSFAFLFKSAVLTFECQASSVPSSESSRASSCPSQTSSAPSPSQTSSAPSPSPSQTSSAASTAPLDQWLAASAPLHRCLVSRRLQCWVVTVLRASSVGVC